MLLVWQVALWGLAAAYTSHAADEAAREAGIGGISEAALEQQSLASVPSFFRRNMDVDLTGSPQRVLVRSRMPILLPSLTTDGLTFTSDAVVISEEEGSEYS